VQRTKQIPGADPRYSPNPLTTLLLGQMTMVYLLLTLFEYSLFSPHFPAGGAWSAEILLSIGASAARLVEHGGSR